MITQLAKMLGLTTEHAEASMHSERAARAVLTRRNLFAAGAALAVGSAFSFAKPETAGFWVQNPIIQEVRLSLQQAVAGYTFPVAGRILGHTMDVNTWEFIVFFQEKPGAVDDYVTEQLSGSVSA